MADLQRLVISLCFVSERSMKCGLVRMFSEIPTKIGGRLTGNMRLITLKLSKQALI